MKYLFLTVCLLFISWEGLQAQTVQAEIPDSVVQKYQCKNVWKLIDAARTQFKPIRGVRKNLKYSVIYQAQSLIPGTSQAEIAYEGNLCQYTAIGIRTRDRIAAAKAYSKMVSIFEHCLEGWVFETETEENTSQLYRFKAYEKEDMLTGITAEITLLRENGLYTVWVKVQP